LGKGDSLLSRRAVAFRLSPLIAMLPPKLKLDFDPPGWAISPRVELRRRANF
jgi:hypothetical protein